MFPPARIPANLFHKNVHKNLRDVRLSFNKLRVVRTGQFSRLARLQTAVLTGNLLKATHTHIGGFSPLIRSNKATLMSTLADHPCYCPLGEGSGDWRVPGPAQPGHTHTEPQQAQQPRGQGLLRPHPPAETGASGTIHQHHHHIFAVNFSKCNQTNAGKLARVCRTHRNCIAVCYRVMLF